MKGGYLYLEDILQSRQFVKEGLTAQKVEEIVRNDVKGRYEINHAPLNGRLRIRAVQGHSATVSSGTPTSVFNKKSKADLSGIIYEQ